MMVLIVMIANIVFGTILLFGGLFVIFANRGELTALDVGLFMMIMGNAFFIATKAVEEIE